MNVEPDPLRAVPLRVAIALHAVPLRVMLAANAARMAGYAVTLGQCLTRPPAVHVHVWGSTFDARTSEFAELLDAAGIVCADGSAQRYWCSANLPRGCGCKCWLYSQPLRID
jgi:hypothetical protein